MCRKLWPKFEHPSPKVWLGSGFGEPRVELEGQMKENKKEQEVCIKVYLFTIFIYSSDVT